MSVGEEDPVDPQVAGRLNVFRPVIEENDFVQPDPGTLGRALVNLPVRLARLQEHAGQRKVEKSENLRVIFQAEIPMHLANIRKHAEPNPRGLQVLHQFQRVRPDRENVAVRLFKRVAGNRQAEVFADPLVQILGTDLVGFDCLADRRLFGQSRVHDRHSVQAGQGVQTARGHREIVVQKDFPKVLIFLEIQFGNQILF